MAARLAFIAVLLLGILWLRGGIIISQHSGAADPTTEGWTQVGAGTGVSTGPIIGDGGFDAWSVNDASTTDDRIYRHSLTVVQAQELVTKGFVERARLRIVGTPTLTNGAISLNLLTSLIGFRIHLGCEADGDPILQLVNDSGTTTLTAQGAGAGYHLYELTYNPATQLADLRLDGQHLADYAGYHPILPLDPIFNPAAVGFGSLSPNGTGAANYNLAQLELLPEPATPLVIAVVCSVPTLRRRRRCCCRASR